ncbi:MAG: trigger factor [Oscillospiraceae bacterium]|nr:trigger factor [Oscillospiraceae bacterium]
MNIGTLEKTGAYTQTFKIEFSPEDFDKAINKVYNNQKSKLAIPGFRKGKVSRKMIEKYYGEEAFYEDAISELLSENIPNIVKDMDVNLVDRPTAKSANVTKEKGLDVEIDLTVKPDITIENYKGIKAPKAIEGVTDEDVDKMLEREQQKRAAVTEITDRPAQDGDTVVIDFKGFLDGEAFQGGEAKSHSLKLGSGQMIPGFEDAIIGHSVGEKFYIDVTFPEEYGMETLAGKQTTFRIKIHSISAVAIPELDDEFAKDISDFNTLEEYKEDLRKKLEESADKAANINFTADILETIVDNEFEGEVPVCMYEQRIDSLIRDFALRLQQQNVSFRDYMAYTNSDEETFREQFRERAENDVKVRLALEKIAEYENLIVSDEEVDKEYAEIAQREDISVEELPKYLSKETVKSDMLMKKANDFLLESSIVDNTIVREKDKEAIAEAVEDIFTEIADNAEDTETQETAE